MNKEKAFKIGAISLAGAVLCGALVYFNFIDTTAEIPLNERAKIGDISPDFTIDRFVADNGKFVLADEDFTLYDHKGKVVVLNFWASWCQPCREEIPHFNELAVNYADSVEVVIINGESPNSQKILDEYMNNPNDLNYAADYSQWLTYDCSFACSPDVKPLYQVGDGFPVTIVLDKESRVQFFSEAKMSYQEIETEIRKYL